MASSYANSSSVQQPINTNFNEPNQMQVKSASSSQCSDILASPYLGHASSANNTNILDRELISLTSRLFRLPSPQPTFTSSTSAAISALQPHSTNTHSGQDVHEFVNTSASLASSSAPRHFGHPPNPSETSVSTPSQLHVLTHPIRRPRTHNQVFQSSKDLAAHYGIPEILPPTPRTAPLHQSAKSPVQLDFQTLSANYLSMLSRKPSDNTNMTESVTSYPTTVTPEELTAPVIPDEGDVAKLTTMLGMESHRPFITASELHVDSSAPPQADTWDMATPCLMDDYSPWSPYLNTPIDSMLDTPLFDCLDESQMLTGPDYDLHYGPLFPASAEWDDAREPVTQSKSESLPKLDVSSLLPISPSSPLLDSFDPSQISSVHQPASSLKPTGSRRKVTATGVRKGVTPETLLDESAPTQTRNYVTPSATSRKEVPAVFARKRGRSTAFGDEEDQLDDYVLPPNPTEKDLIEQKRRQNTVAARRSRKRKLEHMQTLEKSVEDERRQKEQWRQRALMLASMLRDLNQSVPDFSDDW